MKKVTAVLFAMFLLGATCVIAAPNKTNNERNIQATADTVLTFGKVNLFVPAGQALALGQAANGSVTVRANKINGVKIGPATVFAKSPAKLSVDPATNAITVEEGEGVQLTDANGRTVELSKGAVVDGNDVRQSVQRIWPVTLPYSWENNRSFSQPSNTVQKDTLTKDLPEFVDESALIHESNLSEQAVRDVEDTLSASAPTR